MEYPRKKEKIEKENYINTECRAGLGQILFLMKIKLFTSSWQIQTKVPLFFTEDKGVNHETFSVLLNIQTKHLNIWHWLPRDITMFPLCRPKGFHSVLLIAAAHLPLFFWQRYLCGMAKQEKWREWFCPVSFSVNVPSYKLIQSETNPFSSDSAFILDRFWSVSLSLKTKIAFDEDVFMSSAAFYNYCAQQLQYASG